MHSAPTDALTGVIFEEYALLDVEQLSRLCAVDQTCIVELVEEGVLTVIEAGAPGVAIFRSFFAARAHGAAPAARSGNQSSGRGIGAGIAGRDRTAAPRSKGRPSMSALLESDAFVFFGATGDLAYKKIFPALYSMVHRGELSVPVIGIARAGWTLDKLRQRARESVQAAGDFEPDCFAKAGPPDAIRRWRLCGPGDLRAAQAAIRAPRFVPSTIWRFLPACLRASCRGSRSPAARTGPA